MVERAAECARAGGYSNVRIDWGHAECLPLGDASVDVVMANGVLGLTPDKHDTLRELLRVMKPRGRLQAVDLLVTRPLAPGAGEPLSAWLSGTAGALVASEVPDLMRECGFAGVEVTVAGPPVARTPTGIAPIACGACVAEIRAVPRERQGR
jgi:SAM-dependent methyltransferase